MSSVSNAEVLRVLEIQKDEQAVIRVRTQHHISLVFSKCTIDIFEKDGVVYTRQEYDCDEEELEVTRDDNLETQPFDYEDMHTQLYTPPDVIKYAGGDFHEVNDKHESKLQGLDIIKEIDYFVKDDLIDNFDEEGGTQLLDDYTDDEDTQLEYTQRDYTTCPFC